MRDFILQEGQLSIDILNRIFFTINLKAKN